MTGSLLLLAACAVMSCGVAGSAPDEGKPPRMNLLSEGQEIAIRNPNGAVRVRWVSAFVRAYEIDGKTYEVELVQRPREFRYQKGLYSPGAGHSRETQGKAAPVRFVVEESELHFTDAGQIAPFLREGAEYFKWVSNNEGYLAGFCKVAEREQINVSIFRMYLNGRIVRKLDGEFRYHGAVTGPLRP